MIENIKLLISLIVALMDSLPQTFTDTTSGTQTKIADMQYNTIISDGIMGVINGAGFQITGFSNAQIAGSIDALIVAVRNWQAATRIPV